LVALVLNVTVIVEFVVVIEAAVMLLPAVYVTVPLPALNCQFVGAERINVQLFCDEAKSEFAHSATTISPRVVYADPLVELAALSAEIFVPLFPAVTATEKWFDSNVTYVFHQISCACAVVK
jgi:hypothetical protein